jgi:uncharacterized protein YrrD
MMRFHNSVMQKIKGVRKAMKKTQEIIGLPIISISDGVEVGKVKSIIINADKGAIDYIVVDSGIQILSARVIPTDHILGIGEYALTIENEGAINDIGKIPAAIDLLQKNIQVKGTKVLTKKGRLIGEIGDFFIDENTVCSIIGLEYIADITQKRIRIIPRKSVITFGKNLVVVADDVENTLLDRASDLGSVDKSAESEKKNRVNFDQELALDTDRFMPADIEVNSAEAEPVIDTSEPEFTRSFDLSSEENEPEVFQLESNGFGSMPTADSTEAGAEASAASLFEQRQKQYLNGRRATKTVTDPAGNIIIGEGMLINEAVIEEAKQNGKLIELVMNNKA